MLKDPSLSSNNLGACESVLSDYTADVNWVYSRVVRNGWQTTIAIILVNMGNDIWSGR